MKKTIKRYNCIDLLKFLLSIFIVFHHFQLLTGTRFSGFNFYNGKISFEFIVEFFFIISGFIAASNIDSVSNITFSQYMTRKFKRIYPMSILSVLFYTIILLLYKIITGSYFNEWGLSSGVSLWRFATSITLLFDGGAINNVIFALNNPIWYLCVLLICYVLFWTIVRISNKYKIGIAYLAGIVTLLGLGCLQYNINLPFVNAVSERGYSSFFWGVLLFCIYQKANKKKLSVFSFIVLFILILLFCLDFETFYQYQQYEFTYIVFPIILFCFLSVEPIFKGLFWRKLGGISFEIYIWHCCGLLILCMFNNVLNFDQINNRTLMLVFTIITVIWSSFAYLFIEQPISKFFSKS